MTARDADPRNQLGGLPAKHEARCADGGVVFAALRYVEGQGAPFLLTARRPLAVVACEALPEADRLLAQGGARLALETPVAELQGVTS